LLLCSNSRNTIIQLVLDIDKDLNKDSLNISKTLLYYIFVLDLELSPLQSYLKNYLKVIVKYKLSSSEERELVVSILQFLISKLEPLSTNADNKHVILRIIRDLIEDNSILFHLLLKRGLYFY
jgi:hypothetical protein